jgi:hypothetical protein
MPDISAIHAIVVYETAAGGYIISTDNPDYEGVSGTGGTFDAAVTAFAGALNAAKPGAFQILLSTGVQH